MKTEKQLLEEQAAENPNCQTCKSILEKLQYLSPRHKASDKYLENKWVISAQKERIHVKI